MLTAIAGNADSRCCLFTLYPLAAVQVAPNRFAMRLGKAKLGVENVVVCVWCSDGHWIIFMGESCVAGWVVTMPRQDRQPLVGPLTWHCFGNQGVVV